MCAKREFLGSQKKYTYPSKGLHLQDFTDFPEAVREEPDRRSEESLGLDKSLIGKFSALCFLPVLILRIITVSIAEPRHLALLSLPEIDNMIVHALKEQTIST